MKYALGQFSGYYLLHIYFNPSVEENTERKTHHWTKLANINYWKQGYEV